MPFSWKERAAALSSLNASSMDVLVIGGGVVGCSIAAHSAAAGLDTVLVEAQDLAIGASGNSTGLAHAGLRYLAQGQLRYVFKECRERLRLEALAPHWVRPFSFIFPVYRGDPHGMLALQVGTALYDLFYRLASIGLPKGAGRHYRVLSKELILERIRSLRTSDLLGGTQYFVDARLLDSRFTLGFAQAAAAKGGRIATYTAVEAISVKNGKVGQVRLKDRRTARIFEVIPKLVINATGAWIDEIRAYAGLNHPLLQNSKGIHLLVDQLAETPLIFASHVPDKVFFVIPVGRHLSLVGTTDTEFKGQPGQEQAEAEDILSLFKDLVYFFPDLRKPDETMEQALGRYTREHIQRVYWGIRPLVRSGEHTVQASRDYRLVQDLPNFWSVPGVKLTAGRLAGQEVASQARRFLRKGTSRGLHLEALPGGEFTDFTKFMGEFQHREEARSWSGDTLAYLVTLYGTRATDVLRYAQQEKPLRERIHPEEPWILAEARYAAEQEMVITLNDFLWRRTRWARLRDLSRKSLEKITQVLGQSLQWSDEECQAQLAAYDQEWRAHTLGKTSF